MKARDSMNWKKNPIKTALFASAIALTLLLFIGCRSNSGSQIQGSLGQAITLSPGQTATIESENLSFQLIQVSGDSRCAQGVECIRAGDVKCDMQFNYKNETSKITLIDTGGAQGDTQTNFDQYQLSFRVNPYPVYGKTIAPSDYQLRITVTK